MVVLLLRWDPLLAAGSQLALAAAIIVSLLKETCEHFYLSHRRSLTVVKQLLFSSALSTGTARPTTAAASASSSTTTSRCRTARIGD